MTHRVAVTCAVVTSLVSTAVASEPAGQTTGWQAKPEVIERMEAKQPTVLYREERVPAYELPDPLLCADGTRVTSPEQWERARRPETLDLFRAHVYGRSPAAGDVTFDVVAIDPQAMDGRATMKQVRITATQEGKSFGFDVWVFVPNERGGGKAPAFLLINNRSAGADPTRKEKTGFWPAEEVVGRGYAAAVFRTKDVDPDEDGDAARARGVRGAFAGPGKPGQDAWATIAAWAWGASRAMDYLQTDAAIDATRVAVIGHSRGGKTALWAGAQDERFALVISNNSGRGGASLARRRFGESVAIITSKLPYWFCGNYARYADREDELPVDQHQLIALIAPRAVAVGSADEDLWADPRGEFLSLAHASPVFALYGLPALRPEEMPALDQPVRRGNMQYHVRTGNHNLTLYDWTQYMDFADQLWRRAL